MNEFLRGKIPHYLAVVAFLYALGNGGVSLYDALKSGEKELIRDYQLKEYIEYKIKETGPND